MASLSVSRCIARLFLLWLAIALACCCRNAGAQTDAPANRWESRIAAFERADQQQQPPRRGILFVGSSSIRGWKLEDSFPDLPVINRGFGGSHLADCLHFADRIILPYQPRIVVVYAGDNDIAAGKSPRLVADHYSQLTASIHRKLPETRILFMAIKPSIRRWRLVAKMREANRLIKLHIDQDPRQTYVDVDGPMIGDDGRPRQELFAGDGLHLSERGYQLWAGLLGPHLATGKRPAASAPKR